MADIFDSSLNLEETHLKGYKDGLIFGKEEGNQVGLKVGFKVDEELGFYLYNFIGSNIIKNINDIAYWSYLGENVTYRLTLDADGILRLYSHS